MGQRDYYTVYETTIEKKEETGLHEVFYVAIILD